jgi:hypothetical protein
MKATLIQHSGFTVGGDSQFEHAVESCLLTPKEERQVQAAGGLLLDVPEIYDREHAENYPPEVKGLIPKVPGSFSKKTVKGSPIYLDYATTLELKRKADKRFDRQQKQRAIATARTTTCCMVHYIETNGHRNCLTCNRPLKY